MKEEVYRGRNPESEFGEWHIIKILYYFPRAAITNEHKQQTFILEAKSTKPRYQQGCPPLKALGEDSSWPFLAAGGFWHSLACGSITLVSVSSKHLFVHLHMPPC